MPSLWSWLCFPNRRNGRQPKRFDSKRSSKPGTNSNGQKRKYNGRQQVDLIRVTSSAGSKKDARPQLVYPEQVVTNIPQQLPEENTLNKRRRVQDIFGSPERENETFGLGQGRNADMTLTKHSQNMQNDFHRRHTNFGSEYTPKIYQHSVDQSQNESMYGYVPKAVQNVYASGALMGRKIDDYFNDYHRQNSLTHFGNAEQTKKKPGLVSKFSFPKVPSQASITQIDKVSLLDDTNDSEMEISHVQTDWNANGFDVSARFESILNASFDCAWNSKEEVLY